MGEAQTGIIPEQPKPVSTSFTETQRKAIADRLIMLAGTKMIESVRPSSLIKPVSSDIIKSELRDTAKRIKETPEILTAATVISMASRDLVQYMLRGGFAKGDKPVDVLGLLSVASNPRYDEATGDLVSQPIETNIPGVSTVVVKSNIDPVDLKRESLQSPSNPYLYSLKLVPTRINQA